MDAALSPDSAQMRLTLSSQGPGPQLTDLEVLWGRSVPGPLMGWRMAQNSGLYPAFLVHWGAVGFTVALLCRASRASLQRSCPRAVEPAWDPERGPVFLALPVVGGQRPTWVMALRDGGSFSSGWGLQVLVALSCCEEAIEAVREV